jgi:uncharacterized protein GlcG (DUF336 family)
MMGEKLKELEEAQKAAASALQALDAKRNEVTQGIVERQGAIKLLKELIADGTKSEQ